VAVRLITWRTKSGHVDQDILLAELRRIAVGDCEQMVPGKYDIQVKAVSDYDVLR